MKTTPNEYPISDTIKNRWSPRAFDTKEITKDTVQILLEAGRWAPSSNNLQPWRIIWGIKGSDTYDRILDCLADFNKQWAGNAQVLWACAFKKTMKDGEKENFHALHDLGLFMGNVSNQAQELGIALHQMAGIDFKKAAKEFNFTDEYHVATAVAFGYYGGDVTTLPEDLRDPETKTMRERTSQDEFAFNGNFK